MFLQAISLTSPMQLANTDYDLHACLSFFTLNEAAHSNSMRWREVMEDPEVCDKKR